VHGIHRLCIDEVHLAPGGYGLVRSRVPRVSCLAKQETGTVTEATDLLGEFTARVPALRLDLRGQTCPTTSNETLRVLEQLAVGDLLEVVSDYYPARSTLPYHCDKRGYRYQFCDEDPSGLGRSQSSRATWVIRIQKT